MKYINCPAISGSSAANITGASIDASQMCKLSAQIIAEGAAAGTIQLQVSNDINDNFYQQTPVYTNWSNLGSPVTVSSAGATLILQQDMSYRAVRAVWTGSGAGTIIVNIMALCL
jgi:hypothetical protein